MTKVIAIIDYDAGNIRSVYNALEAIGQSPVVTHDPLVLKDASAIVLPGVGAFGDGMASLERRNLIEPLCEEVLIKKKPYLGICLGMQFLARESKEMGEHKGLGWLDGSVRLIKSADPSVRIPHIGWNELEVLEPSPLFVGGIDDRPVFYFVHSYHFEPADESVISSVCYHGTRITASVQKDNIFGVQFHPEKSQKDGISLLENFIKII